MPKLTENAVNRPLCPHCYRDGCPWLDAWQHRFLAAVRGHAVFQPPPANYCTLQSLPIAPNTRKRLLERLGSAPTPPPIAAPDRFGPRPKTREALVREFLAELEACPPVAAPSWVPVSECLPDHMQTVLVAYVLADARPRGLPPELAIGNYHRRLKVWYVNGQSQYDDGGGLRVTHWQPLPAPPGAPSKV